MNVSSGCRFLKTLESIQQRFIKTVDCFKTYDDNLNIPITTTNYHEQENIVSMYILQRQRECYVIIYIFKVAIGTVQFKVLCLI